MSLELTLNKNDMRKVNRALNTAAATLTGANLRKMFRAIGADIDNDVDKNITGNRTFDGKPMPDLKPSTLRQKAKRGEKKLRKNGNLMKIQVIADEDSVRAVSQGFNKGVSYATRLNEDPNGTLGKKFKFMGFGSRLLKAINKTIWKYILNKAFR